MGLRDGDALIQTTRRALTSGHSYSAKMHLMRKVIHRKKSKKGKKGKTRAFLPFFVLFVFFVIHCIR